MLTSVYVCVHVCVHRSLCVFLHANTHTHYDHVYYCVYCYYIAYYHYYYKYYYYYYSGVGLSESPKSEKSTKF